MVSNYERIKPLLDQEKETINNKPLLRPLTQDRKTILFIAPVSPPITGVTLASETLLAHLKKHHDVHVINYNRGNLKSGPFSFRQLIKVLIRGIQILKVKKRISHVYLVISTTFWGNMRDLFFFLKTEETISFNQFGRKFSLVHARYFPVLLS